VTIQTDGKFYLGRLVQPETGKVTESPLFYDPGDLTTHGVVVGMTGSGKTGLCIDLLEEAALAGIPSIMIDPKGDITNALLHFPELRPQDFEPWVDRDQARREGKTVEEVARQTAALWQNGLEQWGIAAERIARLRDAAHFAVYTPGSDAGLPVSILGSLQAPCIAWDANRELIRERVSDTVTAILGLVGTQDIDPVRSREHVLLSNIFEHAWRQDKDLSLPELILQTQSPPFEKLGVFDVDTSFPEKDRFSLAMDLNNMLAAPAFRAWIEGEPLEIGRMLYGSDGRPRHSVFYIAHLSEAERMFFVTLLYSAIESWMRAQPGTGSLRAIVYFDEIFGFLPPVRNPPSKEPMLRMLKQARAFGVGMLLATQNPVDLDYKALSNAGTWFVGKLGTEQDKERLLDGLSTAIGEGLDRSEYDELISRLGKRVFLLRNVHEKHPTLFQTRWAMNYLAGPATRAQIPALNALVGATTGTAFHEPTPAPAPISSAPPVTRTAAGSTHSVPGPSTEIEGSETRPKVPARVAEYFLPNNLTLSEALKRDRRAATDPRRLGILYRPVLLAQAEVRFTQRKYELDSEVVKTMLVEETRPQDRMSWEDFEIGALELRDMDREPDPDARFASLEPPLNDGRFVREAEADFEDWLYRACEVRVKTHEALDVHAGPEVTEAEFRSMCEEAGRKRREAELNRVRAQYERRIQTVEDRLRREKQELRRDEADLAGRRNEELGRHAETLLGLLGGRRRSVSGSLSKRRMTRQARLDVEESEEAIEEYEKQIEELRQLQEDAEAKVVDKWERIIEDVDEVRVSPYKKDIRVTMFGVAWFPYHVAASEERTLELAGFGTGSE
jgi:hypothetical protein